MFSRYLFLIILGIIRHVKESVVSMFSMDYQYTSSNCNIKLYDNYNSFLCNVSLIISQLIYPLKDVEVYEIYVYMLYLYTFIMRAFVKKKRVTISPLFHV